MQQPHPPIIIGASPTQLHCRHIIEYGGAHLGDIGATFVALGLPPLDRDAAFAALDHYAPLVAEFNS